MPANLTEYGIVLVPIALVGLVLTLLLRLCMAGLARGDGRSWIAAAVVGLTPTLICLLGVLGVHDPYVPIATTSTATRIAGNLIVPSIIGEISAMIFAARIVARVEMGGLASRAAGTIAVFIATLALTAVALLAAGQMMTGVSL